MQEIKRIIVRCLYRTTLNIHIQGDEKKHGKIDTQLTLIRRVAMAILIQDKLNIREKDITRDKEGHFMIIKRSLQKNMTILNRNIPNFRVSK